MRFLLHSISQKVSSGSYKFSTEIGMSKFSGWMRYFSIFKKKNHSYITEHWLDLEIAHMKFMQNQQPNENQLRNNTAIPHIWFIQCSNRPKQLYWMCAHPQNSAEMQAILKIKLINSNVMPKNQKNRDYFI